MAPDGRGLVRVRRGKSALSHGAADDSECGDEGDPIKVTASVLSGVDHERADRVVAAQVAPDFLLDQVGGFGPHHHAGSR